MNIFGLFFSFFIPGMVLGMMIMACIYNALKNRRAERRKQCF